ncbi:MAG: transposase family protein [Deltaproteobacteria bacterium]|nr:MAG: transposase family protein [Deltaproteobacteria bacterium]
MGRQDSGSGRCGGRNEHSDGAEVGARSFATVGLEALAVLAHALRSVRGCLGERARAAAHARRRARAAGDDAARVAGGASPRPIRLGSGADVAAAASRVASALRSGARGVLRAEGGARTRGIAGEPFDHLLFEFVLRFSGWRFAQLAYGETYEALVEGLQNALWTLGGVPEVARSDNLSAATHELRHSGGRALNARFAEVLAHYGLRSTRIRPGQSHENGAVEQGHYRLKSALAQALVLRGSTDFATVEAYVAFVQEGVAKLNRKAEPKLAEERAHLRPLPAKRVPAYTRYSVCVRKWSTIRISSRTYSVPSRLIGHRVDVHQHADVVEVYYAGKLVERMPRLRGSREHRIDYRHVIWSLVRKPGAFARYRYREELFPTPVFRAAYDALCSRRGERADIEYVRMLHLAASTLEATVERVLAERLASGEAFDYASVRALAVPEKPKVPELTGLAVPDLAVYDGLRGQGRS